MCKTAFIDDVTTLHETFSAKLLCHDVISLECETKHTNLTLVNERQNNVTSCTNCPYLISTFIPLDVDKFGAVCFFIAFQLFVSWTFFFKYAFLVWNLGKDFFSSTVNIPFAKDGYLWPKVTWPQRRRPRYFPIMHFPIMHHYTS